MPDEPKGQAKLFDALTTKGTAFTHEERLEYGLLGLLPTAEKTLAQQVEHSWHEFSTRRDDLDKHIYLRALQDRNETLFYRLLRENITETMPIVYTPTVGVACQRFSEIYRRPRGLFVSYPDRDRLAEVINNRPHRNPDVIVVTDGQRILGLGDQGIGGMGIPIGKLSLYTLIGGIDPARTLPIVLDVGTDNVELLEHPQYLGWRHRRISDDDYYAFIDEFVAAVKEQLPNVLLQWEDFATAHAQPILDRYRDQLLTFNDDIQGTAAVTLGALHGASKVAGRPLSQQQVVMLGAGSAGIGVLNMVVQEMMAQGLSAADAAARIWVVDITGLLTDDRSDLSPGQQQVRPAGGPCRELGTGGPCSTRRRRAQRGRRHPDGVVHRRGRLHRGHCARSRGKDSAPHHLSAVEPDQPRRGAPGGIGRVDRGRALIATGSPFAPLQRDGVERPIAQCNNVVHLPRDGAGGDRGSGHPGHRRHDEGGGGDPRRLVARTARPGRAAAACVGRGTRHRGAHRARRRPSGRRGGRRTGAHRRPTGRTYRTSALVARVSVVARRYRRREYRSTNRRRIVGGYSICRCRAAVFNASADSGSK